MNLLDMSPYGTYELIQGDVLENVRKLPDNGIKLIITSPPYNIGKSYEKRSSLDEYLEWQRTIISALYPKLHDLGSIVWQTGNFVENGEITPLDICFYPIFKKLGFHLRNRLVWHFEHGLHCKNRFSGRYETALWFTKTDNYTFNLDSVRIPAKYPGKTYFKGAKKGQPSCNPLGKNPSDYWGLIKSEFSDGIINIPNVKANHPEKTSHPCQFPVELIERFVLALTDREDIVFDPFGGSGSTVIAAIKNGRKGIMCEIMEEYIDIANHRIEALFSGELKLRALGKPVYQPTGKEKVSRIPTSWKQGDLPCA